MKKVIIIDDRPTRRELYLSDTDISNMNRLEESGKLSLATEINLSYGGGIEAVLCDYDLIAVHRSYLANNSLYNLVANYAKATKKYLIVFSGGISQSIILNNGFQLNISSAELYTSKLPIFIEQYCSETEMKSPLMQYLYGDSWRLTLLLQYRYLLWTYEDIEEIDDEIDECLAEELQNILWNGDCSVTYKQLNEEIEKEKVRRINS